MARFVGLGPVDGELEFGFVHTDVGNGTGLPGVFGRIVGGGLLGEEGYQEVGFEEGMGCVLVMDMV